MKKYKTAFVDDDGVINMSFDVNEPELNPNLPATKPEFVLSMPNSNHVEIEPEVVIIDNSKPDMSFTIWIKVALVLGILYCMVRILIG